MKLIQIIVFAVTTQAIGTEVADRRIEGVVARPSPITIEMVGECETVLDGDTFVFVADRGSSFVVKLKYADAPNLDQMLGLEAKQALMNMLEGASVGVQLRTVRGFSSPLFAVVTVGGKRVDESLVRDGLAWAVTRDTDDHQIEQSELDSLESEAREIGRGLWIYDDPCPPWIWRESLRPIETRSGETAYRPLECGAIPTPSLLQGGLHGTSDAVILQPEDIMDIQIGKDGGVYVETFDGARFRPGLTLDILIDENGDVEVETVFKEAASSESNRICLDGVGKWKFSPSNLEGTPIKILLNVDVSLAEKDDNGEDN